MPPLFYEVSTMHLYKQYDSRWGKKYYRANSAGKSTMAGTGCGPSACANVYQFTDDKTTPWAAAQWMMKYGYATNGNGTIHAGIKNFFIAMGTSCNWLTERVGNQYGKVAEEYASQFRKAIAAGNWGILLMGKSDWTSAGHYIAVVDYRISYGTEMFYVIDSGAKQRNGWWAWSAFEKYVKHFYVITNPHAGKKGYTGAFPDRFPLRGYYKVGDGWKTYAYAIYKQQIKYIQQFMNWWGASLKVDGEYGEATKAAVAAFQRDAMPGEIPDGLYGRKTLAAAKAYKK